MHRYCLPSQPFLSQSFLFDLFWELKGFLFLLKKWFGFEDETRLHHMVSVAKIKCNSDTANDSRISGSQKRKEKSNGICFILPLINHETIAILSVFDGQLDLLHLSHTEWQQFESLPGRNKEGCSSGMSE